MEITGNEKLEHTLAFIREWLEHGEVKQACDKFKINPSFASKMLHGKTRPKVDFLKELKDKAYKNYSKLKI